ncbi:MAG: carboxypeptidase regulatory-like domain-containing protein [Candidatus Faecousia sp.]|nr:carboxypeptidase regulatory-like domain-containing protein [Candidatus Faecousia sp.]
MKQKIVSRAVAALLAILMVVGVCPLGVFAEGETADVLVTVYSAEDNAPIAGASVSVLDAAPVVTGADGTATLTGLTVGTEYQLSVTAEGYDAAAETFTCAADSQVEVRLTKSAPLLDVKVTVTDGENAPLSGVSVALTGGSTVTTDDTGAAKLTGLTQGKGYQVTASLAGYAPASADFTCDEDTAADGLALTLTPYTKASVSGTVTCGGAAVSGVTVKLTMKEGAAKTAVTGEDGAFSFPDVYKEMVASLTVEDSAPYKSFTPVPAENILFTGVNQLKLEKKTISITTVINGGGENSSVDVEPREVPYGGSAKITVSADPEKYVIYQVRVNGTAVDAASGECYYEFDLTDVVAEQTVTVDFYQEGERITFWVDDKGAVYEADEDGEPQDIPTGLWKFPGLKVETSVDPEDPDAKTQLTVTYTPAKNYRVSAVSVDGGEAEKFDDNDHVYSSESFTLDEGVLRKFELEKRLNQFKITLPADGTVNGPNPVNYNWNAALTITPPDGKYLSRLTVNGTDVTSAVSYSGEKPAYLIKQVREDQTVEAEYADIAEAPADSVTLTTGGKIYNPDGTGTYYLGAAGKVTLAPATTGVSISSSPTGPFSPKLELTTDKTVEALYLLEGTTITKVTYSVETIVDLESPKVTNTKSEKIYGGFLNLQVIAWKWTVEAEDNENGCGIARVVYSTTKKLSYEQVLALETTVPEDSATPGTYVIEFNNVRGKYYFWAIDHLDNVYKFDTELEVDCEVDPPTLNNFQVLGGYVTFSGVNYPTKDGVTFSVSVTDAQSAIQSVTLVIGDSTTIDMEHDKGSVYKATVRPEDVEDIGALSIGVWATDNSANQNKSDTKMLKVPDSEENFLLTFEKDPPVVKFEGLPEKKWCSVADNVTFCVTITDEGSGINIDPEFLMVTYKLENGNEIDFPTKKAYRYEGTTDFTEQLTAGKVVEVKLTVEVNTLVVKKNFDYDFTVHAQDNEGNGLPVASDIEPGLKFSIDITAPVIEKFDIGQKADQKPGAVVATEYGYFFNDAATIRVYASDTGSDVGSISFYKIRGDVKDPEVEPVAADTELKKEGDRWYADFTVEAGFKGQIYAYAVDNAGNSGKAADGAEDAHPEALTTTETQAQHNGLTHVKVELPETTQKDEQNAPLYAGVVYEYDENGNLKLNEDGNPIPAEEQPFENGIPVTVTVSDTFNGIQEASYTITIPGAKGLTGTISVDNIDASRPTYEDENGIEWTVTREKNLVTGLKATIAISEEGNSISVVVTMTDMAGNVTAAAEQNGLNEQGDKIPNSAVLSIDNTPPKIEVSHLSPVEGEPVNLPSGGEPQSSTGTTPYFVGFRAKDYSSAEPYPMYEAGTLQIKIIERNLGNLLKEDGALAGLVSRLFPTKDMNTVNAKDLADQLLVFGPYVDAEGVRQDAEYPYSADTYYLIELRGCSEDPADGGTYRANLTLKDLAGHQAKGGENFVIDTLAPSVSITFNNNDVRNGKYYNANRTATITVVERNFDNSKYFLKGDASLDGLPMEFPGLDGWKDSEDFLTHTATVPFNTDGRYQNFEVGYTDLAGHTASKQVDEFHVDKTMPEIVIADIEDKSANNGTVAPSITYTDINLDMEELELTLTGVNNGPVDYAALREAIHNGEKYIYADFEHIKVVDDVYTLYVKAVDLAGNTTTETIRFSCNRFGSVFDLSRIKDLLGRFNQQGRSLVITETNVDAIDFQKLRVTLTKNGVPVDLVPGKDYQVKGLGSEGTWHQYVYTISGSLFEDDGSYSLYIYSVDAAGNVNENIDETKEAQISFGIDKTKPIVTPIDFESGKQYAEEARTVTVDVRDNLLLGEVKIYLNGEEIPFQTEGDSYTFLVPMRNSKQTVRIVAVDSAGNEQEVYVSDFLVTTNLFVRWYNNTPLFVGTLVLLALILGLLIWWLLLLLRRKRKDEEEA